ncbi:hypothetical protein IFM89_012778 [Coptis chinensis]|uniref:Glycine-rich protein n=1 Tax=Coptis chinensis TaxID=261450 RepID=A0A835H5L3_9MAGN|nr:hypothetical protein IFM89_012778 [Coptis chinensis]
MERVTKMFLLILAVFLVAFVTGTDGAGRSMKIKNKDKADQPQNLPGGAGTGGGVFPFFPPFGGAAGGGVLTYPPFGAGVGFGPSTFCSFPGLGCIHSPAFAASKNSGGSP